MRRIRFWLRALFMLGLVSGLAAPPLSASLDCREKAEAWKAERTRKKEERKKAAQAPESAVDPMAETAGLIAEGYYDAAREILEGMDKEAPDFDAPRYHLLLGLIGLHQGRNEEARDNFNRSIAAGQTDPVVHLYLAQALYRLNLYRETIEALDRAGESGAGLPATYIMRSQCHFKLGEYPEAFAVLAEAEKKFPGQGQFAKQRIQFLIELGLFEAVIAEYAKNLSAPGAGVETYISLGEVLRKSRQHIRALEILEIAKLGWPGDAGVVIALAHVYLDMDRKLTAAKLFEEASRLDPKYISEAAELYRRAGEYDRALHLNAQIGDQKVKTRQRLAIYFETQRYEQAAAMEAKLSRLGLLEDEDVRYALGYSLFKIGEYERARRHLKKLTRPDLFAAAADLLQAMEVLEKEN